MGGKSAGRGLEHFHVQLAHAAHAATAVVELAGVLLGVVDELLEGLERQAAVHHQRVGQAPQDGDVFKVLDRVVAHLGLGQRVGQMAALRRHHQGVAVGLGTRHVLRTHRATRTGTVFHHDGHAQHARQRLRILAGHDVHRTTGWEGHHHGDGARRVFVLRTGRQRSQASQAQADGKEKSAGREFHRVQRSHGINKKSSMSALHGCAVRFRGAEARPVPLPGRAAQRWSARNTRARCAGGRPRARWRTGWARPPRQ